MHYGAAHSVGSPPLVGRGWGWGSCEMTILCLNRRAPHPTPCMGLSVSSSNFATRFSPLAWSFDWGVAVDGPAPLDHHESGGAGPSTAPARSRQSEASLPSGGDDRATTLYSVWDGSWRASARHPNHDAAMLLGGGPILSLGSKPWVGAGHRHLGSSWRCIAPAADERQTCLTPPLLVSAPCGVSADPLRLPAAA